MINAYKNGKDLYATIASKIYHNNYEDNLEHYPDGTENPEGAKRRKSTKGILLGILYGMGNASLAATIKSTPEEAQKIIGDFYKEFPNVKRWMDETNANAKKTGYVEDFWGRRRHLPDLCLPRYVVKDVNGESKTFNPMLHCKGIFRGVENPKIEVYKNKLRESRGYQEVNAIKQQAKVDGIDIQDNGGFISRAERQCVNARVQGGAATMTKKAMIEIYHDQEMKDLGFTLLLAIHDELIGECPSENAQKVADRLAYLMKQSAFPEVKTPFKCDAVIFKRWYEDVVTAELKEEYNKKLSKGSTRDNALDLIKKEHPELLEEDILRMVS